MGRTSSAVLVLVACLFGARGLAADSPPRLEIAEPVIELGDVLRGTKVEVEFRVRNGGGSPLVILGAKPG